MLNQNSGDGARSYAFWKCSSAVSYAPRSYAAAPSAYARRDASNCSGVVGGGSAAHALPRHAERAATGTADFTITRLYTRWLAHVSHETERSSSVTASLQYTASRCRCGTVS